MSTMFPRLAALAATAMLLAGCQTAEEIRANDENRCVSYGFRPRTDAFAACLQRIDLDRRESLRQSSRDALFMPQPVIIVHERRH
ncbi:hypothetical protein [Shinella zoogloeoides]|jgi:hypothetical protein|uniref:hypothetical protein n=1 Tax=Shinella zoogloeoides TaxID=352475 RepID=UPI00274010C0|nr:hypothetical protein [Shinella zoogloeoides]WLR93523.1 hypothetical protein Q9316_04810 [Shinella zoogloeoides]